MSARHKPIEASELWVWRKSIDEDSCAEIEVTVAERDGLRADVERLTAARDAAYSDGVSAAEARLKTERDQLRAELAAVENLVDALNTQRGEDAVAAMRAVAEKGEEVREACALRLREWLRSLAGEFGAVATVAAATPLDATPLRERIAELEAAGKVLVAANTRHFDSARENYARAESAEAERDALKAELAALTLDYADSDKRIMSLKAQVERLAAALRPYAAADPFGMIGQFQHEAREALKETP